MAATGWWFILWLWAPIYGNILAVQLFEPLWATIEMDLAGRRRPVVPGEDRYFHRDADHDRDGRRAGLAGNVRLMRGCRNGASWAAWSVR